jgi:hypothetical protein
MLVIILNVEWHTGHILVYREQCFWNVWRIDKK